MEAVCEAMGAECTPVVLNALEDRIPALQSGEVDAVIAGWY